MHIPVRIISSDPAETQAFADVLGGQGGALALAQANEKPLVVLVCPSGITADMNAAIGALPAVILGENRQNGPESAQFLPSPSKMSDILEVLEALASDRAGFSMVRHYKGWNLDPIHLILGTPEGDSIPLTDTEARLLACLFDAAGGEVGRDELLQRVWGYRPGLETHTLETHIYRLRKKVEPDPTHPNHIITTEGGYHFAS